MNILYFTTHQMWPLTGGARLRDYHLAKQLATRCDVTYVEMLHPIDERHGNHPADSGFTRIVTVQKDKNYRPLNVLKGLVGPTPVTFLNYYSKETADTLASVLRSNRFDTIQLESVHLSVYLPIINAAPSPPMLLADWHNVESELLWRYASTTGNPAKAVVARRTAQLVEQAETRELQVCGACTIPSEREKQKLLESSPGANIHVIPNGVDTSYYAPSELAKITSTGMPRRPYILFVGMMDYHANVEGAQWFVQNVWPRLSAQHPELNFVIVGRNPTAAVRALATDRIHVTGTVDDVRPFYRDAAAVAVPLHIGSGTRLKILEAMAAGVPVISTTLGAEGIDCTHDVHLLVADEAESMAAALNRVISSPEVCGRLSKAARELAVSQYDWRSLGARLYDIHSSLVKQRAATHEIRS